MHKKLGLLVVAVVFLVGACGFQNRSGYVYDNHRFNYVRIEKFKDAKDKNINHPYTFNEPQISTTLKMIEIKKGSFASDDEKIREVFNSYSIGKLTPFIVKAFLEVKPNERLAFAFLVKDPKLVVIRSDRLTTGYMWVEDNKLHIEFDKLAVLLTGDYDKRGYSMARLVQNARGLRVSLDLKPGQEFGDSTNELVIDPVVIAKVTDERLKKEQELAEKGVDATVRIEAVNKDKSDKQRLKELDSLRKERMITEEEYQQKRKEILNQL